MSSLRTLSGLLFAHARHQPARLLLASMAVIAASCAVVWVVSGYDALVSQFDEHASSYMGCYDVIMAPGGPMGGTLPASLIDELRADPAVAKVNPITQTRVSVTSAKSAAGGEEIEPGTQVMGGTRPPVYGAPPLGPTLVGTNATQPPYELVEGEWLTDQDSAVLSDRGAKRLGIEVGDQVLVTSLTNQKALKLVGLVRQPVLSPSFRGPPGQTGGRGRAAQAGNRPSGKGGPGRGGGRSNEPPARGERPGGGRPGGRGPASGEAAGRPSLPGVYGSGPAANALYVTMDVAAEISGYQSPPTVVQLALHEDVVPSEFLQRWQPRLAESSPGRLPWT